MLVGSERVARGVRIERNRIAHCGKEGKFDHLIYVARTRGVVIRRNLLTDNPGGWAVHLYPDADGSLIERNTISGNLGGVIFAGDGEGLTSDRNLVRNNTITGSGARWNLESSWSGGPAGALSLAQRNCLHSDGAGAPSGVGPHSGVQVVATTVAPAAECIAPRIRSLSQAARSASKRPLLAIHTSTYRPRRLARPSSSRPSGWRLVGGAPSGSA